MTTIIVAAAIAPACVVGALELTKRHSIAGWIQVACFAWTVAVLALIPWVE